MQKIVKIGGKEVTFKSVGSLPKIYKMYFQRDFFEDLSTLKSYETIMMILKGKAEGENVFEKVAWVLAKTANPNLPQLETWKESFEDFSIKDVIREVQIILSETIETKKKEVKKNGKSSGGSINLETYLILCKDCGLMNDDLETMTIGMTLDYIDQYIEMKNPDKKPKAVMASQSHFDNF